MSGERAGVKIAEWANPSDDPIVVNLAVGVGGSTWRPDIPVVLGYGEKLVFSHDRGRVILTREFPE